MERLRQLYIRAFEDYSEKARCLQSLTAQPQLDQSAIDSALLDLEKARLNYNNCRDLLAAELLRSAVVERSSRTTDDRAKTERAKTERAKTDRVRAVAGLRWEVAGRPEGTAEEDWFRAEEIVGSAA